MRSLIFCLLFSVFFVNAQTVEVLPASQKDNKILVNYKILNSTSDQNFTVTISCLVNNKDNVVLTSVTGDVGPNVVGGKSSYTAIWDVLADVENLTDAKFSVKIDLQKKINYNAANAVQEHPWFAAYNAGVSYTPLGFRLGYANNWGGYIGTRFGGGSYAVNGIAEEVNLSSFTLGITKKIVSTKNVTLHAYCGVGSAIWGDYAITIETIEYGDSTNGFQDIITYQDWDGDDDQGFEVEYGLFARNKRLVFTAGLAHNVGDFANNTDLVLGIGFSF
jgi:hypothetical protein